MTCLPLARGAARARGGYSTPADLMAVANMFVTPLQALPPLEDPLKCREENRCVGADLTHPTEPARERSREIARGKGVRRLASVGGISAR